MSPPSVFDRFGRISTFPLSFTRQASNGVSNGYSTTEGNTPGSQLVESQVNSTDPPPKILQCFREICGCTFSDDYEWSEHNKNCDVKTLRYRCVFTKCAESFASDAADAFIRHQKMHRIWICKKAECFSQFDKRDKALKHATKDHRFESPGDWVKETWIATALKTKKGIRYQKSVDLELANFLEELEAKMLGKKNRTRTPTLSGGAHPHDHRGARVNGGPVHVTLPSAVFTCITEQLNIVNTLLDHHSLIPTASESQILQQILDKLQEKLRTGEIHRTIPAGWNGNFSFGSVPAAAASHEHITHASPNSTGQEFSAAIVHSPRPRLLSPPPSNNMSPLHAPDQPQYQEESHSEDDSDIDEDVEDSELAHLNLETDIEPRQDTHLEKSEQIRYFDAMQKCCIEAAFAFYQRHKAHLDTINDRSSKPLCQTAKKGPIEQPADLSLPHWTHLLRRISDARGLQKEMVSRIESFNGDISPVDELQHAFKKEKVKSDRDLLALIQLTRNFCWQLKDWEKCRQLDDLYEVVDKSIRQVKRKDSQTSRKQRPKLVHGDRGAVHRQSATWPRAITVTDEDVHT